MCGITGIWSLAGGGGEDFLRYTASRMSDALLHRGPDTGDVWTDADAGLALGHRRLSVLDLSPRGAQPMASHDGRYVVSFNGEVYNHAHLRLEIQARAPATVWRGHSDTEALVETIALWGFEAALPLLEGMFAFAVWDRRERVLSLAIDRLGEKPLYYGAHAGNFFFASEPVAFKALRGLGWEPQVHRDALGAFLRFGYVPAPHSIYRNVWKLEPGSFLQVRQDTSKAHSMRRGKYWDLLAVAHRARAHRFQGGSAEAVEALDQRLRGAVARQTRADVPLGAFLSGGVDSSTVAALMQAQSPVPIKTFTIGFDSSEHDETDSARRVAAHLGTDHTELRMDWRAALDLVPRIPDIWSEPFADPSQLPTALVSGLARRSVTVALSGDGGDELFGGYNRHLWAHGTGRRLEAWPGWLKRGAAAGLRSLSPGAWDSIFKSLGRLGPALPRTLHLRTAGDKIHKLAEALAAQDGTGFYQSLVSSWRAPGEILPGVHEPEGWIEASRGWEDASDPLDPVERMMLLDMLTYLPGDILTKVDRASMSVSLETRLPFLDREVVEFALSLPLSLKLQGSETRGHDTKWVLRRVLDRYVPRVLIERPKTGFGVPLAEWLRGPLRDWAETLLDASRLAREGYFEPGPIRRRWRAHLAGKGNHQNALWNVLMFQAWLEKQGRPPGNSV